MNLMITDAGKAFVGRPRPFYATLCWSDGKPALFESGGNLMEQPCDTDATLEDLAESRKSFPSGEQRVVSGCWGRVGVVVWWCKGVVLC